MQSQASNPDEYLQSLPEDRRTVVSKLRETLQKHLPKGFSEQMNYGMIGYVVPFSLYPSGYHCDPKLPLPFIAIASQKNFVSFYHMGIYALPELLEWFVDEFPKHTESRLDMGKSCIRFKKLDKIPYALIGQLAEKISPKDWIVTYEKEIKKGA